MSLQRLISGIKPTGTIHIGNYFGAMRQMVELQDDYKCFIFIADLHALNQVHEAATLQRDILEIAKSYLAVGIDPAKTILFQQSAVPEVGTFATILASLTSFGLLERAHAFKDAKAKGLPVNAGLVTYPVLMAADILLYKANVVPVGHDQQQHLEMTRVIAERFNHLYGQTLVLPQEIHDKDKSVIGLDGRKMSKSYDNVIGLFEPDEEVVKKIMRIPTDSKGATEPKDPDTCTVFSLHALVTTADELDLLRTRYREGTISYKESKELLAEQVVAFLKPLQAKKAALDADEAGVRRILQEGSEAAQVIATQTLQEVRRACGLTLS